MQLDGHSATLRVLAHVASRARRRGHARWCSHSHLCGSGCATELSALHVVVDVRAVSGRCGEGAGYYRRFARVPLRFLILAETYELVALCLRVM